MRFLAILSLAALALSCSSKAEPVVSGGAQFRLQNALPADRGTLGPCPENQVYTVAQRGEDGQLKLVVNGADDARVDCAVENGRFSISVSRAAASFSASGTIVGTSSSNADVTVVTPSNVFKTRDKKCTITFTELAGGKLRGKVKCPLVEHTTLNNACSTTEVPVVDMDGVDRTSTFFAFANCSGV